MFFLYHLKVHQFFLSIFPQCFLLHIFNKILPKFRHVKKNRQPLFFENYEKSRDYPIYCIFCFLKKNISGIQIFAKKITGIFTVRFQKSFLSWSLLINLLYKMKDIFEKSKNVKFNATFQSPKLLKLNFTNLLISDIESKEISWIPWNKLSGWKYFLKFSHRITFSVKKEKALLMNKC